MKTYILNGMHCASCVSSVENILNSIKGVKSAVVNLPLETVRINYDYEVSIEYLKEVLSKNGFQLQNESNIEKKNNPVSESKKHLLIKLFLATLLFIYSMVSMTLRFELSWISILTQFCLVTPILYLSKNIYKNGFYGFKNKIPNMNSLVALGTLSAYLYSIISSINIIFKLDLSAFEKIYFESAGIILLFITIGKFIESKAKEKTSSELKKLLEHVPITGYVKKGQKWKEIHIDAIIKGDILMIKPGGKVPVDGIVIEGNSHVSEAVITGESSPIKKNIGDNLIGSSMNTSGTLIMRALKIGKETTFSKIIQMVQDAQNTKAPIQTIADKVASVFVPVVLFLAIASFFLWLIIGHSLVFAFNIFISVLIIACPCALGLATPTAIIVGTGLGANLGIHFKSAESMQNLSEISSIFFDKTGTLTVGKPQVVDFKTDLNEDHFIQQLASLESGSEHVLAKAILDFSEIRNLKIVSCKNIKTIAGKGIEGVINGVAIQAGKLTWLNKSVDFIPPNYNDTILKWDKNGYSIVCVALKNKFIGMVAISDAIRDDSKYVIDSLLKNNISVNMLTGDRSTAGNYIAKKLGIKNFKTELLPSDKVKTIIDAQKTGIKVAMVGDGINDAPALAQAEVGISIGSGTDIALETSDVVIIQNKLIPLINSIKLSRAVVKKIKQNLFWAFIYNIIGIPIAMGLLYPFNGYLLNPIFAGGAMALSSISVLGNTLLLTKNTKFT